MTEDEKRDIYLELANLKFMVSKLFTNVMFHIPENEREGFLAGLLQTSEKVDHIHAQIFEDPRSTVDLNARSQEYIEQLVESYGNLSKVPQG